MRPAEVQVADKDLSAARESARKALAMKPDSVEAQRMLIALDLDSGRDTAALAMCATCRGSVRTNLSLPARR